MLRELFRRESELLVGNPAIDMRIVVVVGIDDKLTLDGHRIVLGIIEINSPTKAARGLLTSLIQHGRRPHDRHARRYRELALLDARRIPPAEKVGRPGGFHGLAAG